jgi:hypothetical protein
VGAHHYHAFDVVGQSCIAAGFPIGGGLRFFAEHHCRAMGEEVHWWRGHGDILALMKREQPLVVKSAVRK